MGEFCPSGATIVFILSQSYTAYVTFYHKVVAPLGRNSPKWCNHRFPIIVILCGVCIPFSPQGGCTTWAKFAQVVQQAFCLKIAIHMQYSIRTIRKGVLHHLGEIRPSGATNFLLKNGIHMQYIIRIIRQRMLHHLGGFRPDGARNNSLNNHY